MAFFASKVQLSYEFVEMLPQTDSSSITYRNFKEKFGQDGSVMFIGIEDSNLFKLAEFNDFFDLTNDLKKIDGVQEVVSITKMFCLVKNDSTRKFGFLPIVKEKPKTQTELDSLKDAMYSYKFYNGLLFNSATNVNLIMITLDKTKINSSNRFTLINKITETSSVFTSKYNIKPHYSGLPYIRTITSKKVKNELVLFILLSLLVAAIVLFFYFRSIKAVAIPVLIVCMGVIWGLGLMVLFGFKITILTGIIPPLIIVIGIENCIFLINKYHFEYRLHGNKVKALSRIVQRVGLATLLTNAAAAAGFAAFIITRNQLLYEFGLVASINIMVVYVISLFLIPIFFSYMNPPTAKHTKHLDNRVVKGIVEKIVSAVQVKRKLVYIIAILFLIGGGFGMSLLKTSGRIVDDISSKDPMYKDLMFFEKHFKGVMPLEISIDTRKKKGVMSLSVFRKIDRLQDSLTKIPELSKPLSVVEVVKFAKQAFYGNDSAYYSVPNGNEMAFMLDYIPKYNKSKKSLLNSFVDSTLQSARISVQMANVGTKDIERIYAKVRSDVDTIFDRSKYDVAVTGTSVVFAKGTNFLVDNLGTSLLLALVVIAMLMFLLFRSPRMVLIAIIPNLLPQIMTAAMMGYLGIAIKPSTILIFSIALGISIDNTILFLSRYRFQLKHNKNDLRECVLAALRETGFSMIYSSSVLFLGFSIFVFSTFGGTQSMGYLISFTLFMAMISNLFLLPSLLLTFGKKAITKSFEEPVLELDEGEEDTETEQNTITELENELK
jgi:predicted RND superfamily exporter protein